MDASEEMLPADGEPALLDERASLQCGFVVPQPLDNQGNYLEWEKGEHWLLWVIT